MTTPLGSSFDYGGAVTIQSDGKIVVGGSSRQSSNGLFDAVVLRYNSDGQPDTEFDHTGLVTTPTNSSYDAHRLTLRPDNKIVVTGDTKINGSVDFLVLRYDATGDLDTTFNGTGVVTTPGRIGEDIAASVTIQSDGKIRASKWSKS